MSYSDSCEYEKLKERFYLPSNTKEVNCIEYLKRYIDEEFPFPKTKDISDDTKNKKLKNSINAIYSVPRIFEKNGQKQGSLAEQCVFHSLHKVNLKNLWMIFFHSLSYGGQSFRNERLGKLMIREHDFVAFVKFEGKYHLILVEVKSSSDLQSQISNNINLEKTSASKLIKNNKRSAQHQLRDHLEIIDQIIHGHSNKILQFIMWPFLKGVIQNSSNKTALRWKEDKNLHVFTETLCNQDNFNKWILKEITKNDGIQPDCFYALLNRFIILSSGVFVNEIKKNMMALLTQEQRNLLCREIHQDKIALVVHGAAGTGKTLLVLKKLENLYHNGKLNEQNRALYICYWPGIRADFENKLETIGIRKYVDTCRFYITLEDFNNTKKKPYKHIFQDESEALCLAFDAKVVYVTMKAIYQQYHIGNCKNENCTHKTLELNEDLSEKLDSHPEKESIDWGEIWFMADANQVLFHPINSPKFMKTSTLTLSKVMRSTCHIFNIYNKFYTIAPQHNTSEEVKLKISNTKVTLGHTIRGPPVYWADSKNDIVKVTVKVIVDLCATKGFQGKDICVLPFLCNEKMVANNLNKCIDSYFVENTYRPRCIQDVEYYLHYEETNQFLLAWALRVKGLEFKVVVMVVDEDDFDCLDPEDRKKVYIISSRSTTMLILVSNKGMRKDILAEDFVDYPFHLEVHI